MEEIEIAFIVITVCLSNVLCFLLGAKVSGGYIKEEKEEQATMGDKIMNAHIKRKNKKEEQKEQETLKTIMENIDNYDGTALGQKDLPR